MLQTATRIWRKKMPVEHAGFRNEDKPSYPALPVEEYLDVPGDNQQEVLVEMELRVEVVGNEPVVGVPVDNEEELVWQVCVSGD